MSRLGARAFVLLLGALCVSALSLLFSRQRPASAADVEGFSRENDAFVLLGEVLQRTDRNGTGPNLLSLTLAICSGSKKNRHCQCSIPDGRRCQGPDPGWEVGKAENLVGEAGYVAASVVMRGPKLDAGNYEVFVDFTSAEVARGHCHRPEIRYWLPGETQREVKCHFEWPTAGANCQDECLRVCADPDAKLSPDCEQACGGLVRDTYRCGVNPSEYGCDTLSLDGRDAGVPLGRCSFTIP